jgi:hypothetical protein
VRESAAKARAPAADSQKALRFMLCTRLIDGRIVDRATPLD